MCGEMICGADIHVLYVSGFHSRYYVLCSYTGSTWVEESWGKYNISGNYSSWALGVFRTFVRTVTVCMSIQ
jgi:hypothetical protein